MRNSTFYYKNKSEDEKKEYWIKHNIENRFRSSISRAKKYNRLPKWANKEKMKEYYKDAVLLCQNGDIKYEVDHIIPLNGNNVCGLHVENNLKIITREENLQKNNFLMD